MGTISSTYRPLDAHQPRGKQPWCATCDTDVHLVVDSITMMDRHSETLAAAFNCAKCGGARVLSTTAGFVAAVLARSTANGPPRDLLPHPGTALPARLPNGKTALADPLTVISKYT